MQKRRHEFLKRGNLHFALSYITNATANTILRRGLHADGYIESRKLDKPTNIPYSTRGDMKRFDIPCCSPLR